MEKAVTYNRVSSKEQQEHGYSPDAQKRVLYGFAKQNTFDVVEEFEEAESSKQAGRGEFNRMIEYVKKYNIKHIIVEKTDRLQRNFKDYSTIEDLMNDFGVTIHLVKEAASLSKDSTSQAKFMYGIRTLMAKNYIDNLSEETIKGLNEKVAAGIYPSRAPLGYKNVIDPITKKAIIVIDPDNKPLIEALFRLYATGGYSLNTLIAEVNRLGLTKFMPHDRKLNKTTLSKVLKDMFYMGSFVWGKKRHNGTHELFVNPNEWQKAQGIAAGRNIGKVKQQNTIPFAFKGIFKCAVCGRNVTAYLAKGKYPKYTCTHYETNCTQPAANEEVLHSEVQKLVHSVQTSEAGNAYLKAALKKSLEEKREWHGKGYEGMLQEKAMLNSRLDKIYEDKIDGRITQDFYDKKFKEYTERVEKLTTETANYERANINYYEFGLKILELANNAEKLYEMATPEEKQELLRFLLSNSLLKDRMPIFTLRIPFNLIAKRPPLGERQAWGGQRELNPYCEYHKLA
jgi:site-specific DNA recombinase